MPRKPIKETIEALYKPIESIVKTLAGPAAEEIGLTFRDSVQAWRFKRQVRLFERVKEFCQDAGIDPNAVKLSFLFDVVDKGSLEEDNELQDMWAALLANAADPNRESLVSSAFPEILKQLSKDEVQLLELLKTVDEDIAFVKRGTTEWGRIYTKHWSPRISEFPKVLTQNLYRLCLVHLTSGHINLVNNRTLTDFGTAFVKACTRPKRTNEKLQ